MGVAEREREIGVGERRDWGWLREKRLGVVEREREIGVGERREGWGWLRERGR